MPTSKPDLIRLVDAARILGCGYAVVYTLMLKGKLPSERIGKAWYVDRRSVERAQREQNAAATAA